MENAERVDTEWTLDMLELEDTISAIRWHNVRWIITGLLAAIAMSVFLSLVLLPGWTYNVLKNAELYGYHEGGATYAQEFVGGHRARDERQPVMGWIILMLLSVLLWFGALSQFGSTAWATIVNFGKTNTQQAEAAPSAQPSIAPVMTDTATVEPERIDTLSMDPADESMQEAEAFLVGTWVGEMGGKPLRIVIERAADGRLEGYNVLGPTQRPIQGPYSSGYRKDLSEEDMENIFRVDPIRCNLAYEATLSEPDDDLWDGVFRLQFHGTYGIIGDEYDGLDCVDSYFENASAFGTWKSNNGKLTRTFTINKSDLNANYAQLMGASSLQTGPHPAGVPLRGLLLDDRHPCRAPPGPSGARARLHRHGAVQWPHAWRGSGPADRPVRGPCSSDARTALFPQGPAFPPRRLPAPR